MIKGGLVSRTFALAVNNDSNGRKSRIRRSKEERKEMVESFIKKYQKSNNGNFPSLNVTHKEVGGSFYTVREIVREIIQENRVLGPAKSFPNEDENAEFLKKYPIGSISVFPQTDFLSDKTQSVINITPNDTPIPDDASVEELSKANKQFSERESRGFVDEHVVSSSIVDQSVDKRLSNEKIASEDQIFDRSEVLEERRDVELEVRGSWDREKDGGEELKVEKFAMRSLSAIHDIDGASSKSSDVNGALGIKTTEKALKDRGPSLETSNCYATNEATPLDTYDMRNVEAEHSSPHSTMEVQSHEQLISKESNAVGEKSNILDNDSYLEERITPKTSEGSSKKTSTPETNGLWALLLAFLLAFVKLWTK